jgi:hypothetical protein
MSHDQSPTRVTRGKRGAPGLVNAHTHLYSGLAPLRHARARGTRARELRADPRARLVAARPRARRGVARRQRRAVRRRRGGAGHRGADRSPRVAGLHRGLARRAGRRVRALGMPAVLCYGATERNGGRDEAKRGLAECARFAQRQRRPGCAAWWGCTPRSPCPTTPSARPRPRARARHRAARPRGRGRRRRGRRPRPRLRRRDRSPDRARRDGPGLDLRARRAPDRATRCARATRRASGWCRTRAPTAATASATRRRSRPRPASRSAPTAIPRRWPTSVAALLEESAVHGDDPARVAARPAAGATLLAERFGGPVRTARRRSHRPRHRRLPDIRAHARIAPALWARMALL